MLIESYQFGRMVIGDRILTKDLLLLPGGRIQGSWWREAGHSLVPADLGAVAGARPEVFVMGTGAYGALRVPDSTVEWLQARGIRLEQASTAHAVEIWNRYALDESLRVAAGFHLTC